MTIQSIVWVLEQSESTGADRCVLIALANRFDRDEPWRCWPSVDRLAREANVSPRTVQRCLSNLEEMGELIVYRNAGGTVDVRKDRRPNLYVLPALTDWRLGAGCQSVAPQDPDGVTSATPRGDICGAHGVTTLSPNPLEDPLEIPQCDDDVVAPATFDDFWQQWTPVGGRGKGPKRAARDRYDKLGPKLRERMLETTRGYLAMCDSEQRSTVDCATWLGEGPKSWRSWEGEFDTQAEIADTRPDFRSLPPSEWSAAERSLVVREVAERPPDMWEPAALRLLMHARPEGAEVSNALGPVPFPPVTDTPGCDASDDELLQWWDAKRAAAA